MGSREQDLSPKVNRGLVNSEREGRGPAKLGPKRQQVVSRDREQRGPVNSGDPGRGRGEDSAREALFLASRIQVDRLLSN